MTKATIKKVNAAIRKISGNETSELVKGNGYLYFWGDLESAWGRSSVYTCYLGDFSLEQWVDIYQEFYNEYEGQE